MTDARGSYQEGVSGLALAEAAGFPLPFLRSDDQDVEAIDARRADVASTSTVSLSRSSTTP